MYVSWLRIEPSGQYSNQLSNQARVHLLFLLFSPIIITNKLYNKTRETKFYTKTKYLIIMYELYAFLHI